MKQTKGSGGPLTGEAAKVLCIVLTAVAVAAGLHIFAYRANFSPSGIDGLATMLHYLTRELGFPVNPGVFTLLLNLPLLLLAFVKLRRRYVLYTLLYIGVLSLSLVFYEAISLYQYDCLTEGTKNSPLIAAVFAGVIQGLTGIPLRLGGSSGGSDIIGGLLFLRAPHRNIEQLISLVGYCIVGLAFLVYRDIGAACLSLISVFTCERVSASLLRPTRGALRFDIFAPEEEAEEVRRFVLSRLGHGVTLLRGEGGFTREGRCILVCIVGYPQLGDFLAFLKTRRDIFYCYNEALGLGGDFTRKWHSAG